MDEKTFIENFGEETFEEFKTMKKAILEMTIPEFIGWFAVMVTQMRYGNFSKEEIEGLEEIKKQFIQDGLEL